MARVLIRQAHGGQTRVIDDGALPFFPGYVILETLDDSADELPLYLTREESDFRYVLKGDEASSSSVAAADITDSTPTGQALLTAADEAEARQAIGVDYGTIAGTVKAGDWVPVAGDIADITAVGQDLVTAVDQAAARGAIGAGTSNLAASSVEGIVFYSGSAWPARPAGFARIRWVSNGFTAAPQPAGMVAGDVWEHDV